jgi:hypothetical protein
VVAFKRFHSSDLSVKIRGRGARHSRRHRNSSRFFRHERVSFFEDVRGSRKQSFMRLISIVILPQAAGFSKP